MANTFLRCLTGDTALFEAKIPALNYQPKPPESVFNETSVESEESDANA